jgi:mannose-6-phosphate isomerase-like protein (cupin superfamily)
MSFFPEESRPPIVLGPDEGQPVVGPTGQPMFIKANSADTRGAYAAIEYRHAPGAAGPPAHVHHHHEEAFLVIEGELTLLLGDTTTTVGPGGFALVPRGTVHRPSNRGTTVTRFIFVTSPPMEGFFLEMQELLQRTNSRPSATDLADLGTKWDSTFVDLGPTDTVLMHNE